MPLPDADFDVERFLSQPLTARVATHGPTVRPTWFLWEDQAFWILTGPWSHLADHVRRDPAVALVIDVCDLSTGLVRQVIVKGTARILPFDTSRARRKLARYLGPDLQTWDPRFLEYVTDPSPKGARWLRIRPDSLTARDLSFTSRAGDRPPPPT